MKPGQLKRALHPRRAWGITLSLTLLACGGAGTDIGKNPRFKKRDPAAVPNKIEPLPGPPALPSVVIAELSSPDKDVHFVRNGAKGLLISRSHGRWVTGPVFVDRGDDAVPEEAPKLRKVAAAPETKTATAVRAVGDGFVLLWVMPTDDGAEVNVVALGSDGAAQGEPQLLARSYERIDWVDILTDPRAPNQAMLLWEQRQESGSDVVLASYKPGGKAGDAISAAKGVSGWQAAATKDGAAVVWTDKGNVRYREISHGGVLSAPIKLDDNGRALSDVQIAVLRKNIYTAWTDQADGDANVMLAHIEGGKLMAKPAPAVPPIGGQALVALVASEEKQRALLAYENELGSSEARTIELEIVSSHAAGSKARAALRFQGADTPHFVADGAGFAALTLAPAVDGSGDASFTAPTFVRFDRALGVRASEPIRVQELAGSGVGLSGVPASVRSLHCEKDLCSLVATGSGTPALLSLVTLPVRKTPWQPPVGRVSKREPPLAKALSTVAASTGPVADMSVAKLHDGRHLVAWVSHHTGSGEGPAPPGAKLRYRFIDGAKLGTIHTLSERAISIGGVKVVALPAPARAGKKAAVAIIGWAGPNAHASQVFVSRLGADGKTQRQKTVTKITRPKNKSTLPNEVYDIDLTPTPGGNLVVSWADTRDGNAEIYVARVTPNLEKIKRDVRVTNSSGASVEPAIVPRGEGFLMAWSDAVDRGAADIHLIGLDKNLAPQGAPTRLSESANHSRSPQWTTAAGGTTASALTWIEESTANEPGGARMIALGSDGTATSAIRRIDLTNVTQTTSVAVQCSDTCVGLVAGAVGGTGLRIGAFQTRRDIGAPIKAKPIATLGARSIEEAGLRLTDKNRAFFLHNGSVRRLDVTW